MQFVLMIYQGTTPLPNTASWETLSSDEQKAIYADYAALNQTPGLTPGPPLGLPDDATTVRVDAGGDRHDRRPYVDVKGAVGGFFVLEAEDLAAAVESQPAFRPPSHGGAVEMRPVATYW